MVHRLLITWLSETAIFIQPQALQLMSQRNDFDYAGSAVDLGAPVSSQYCSARMEKFSRAML